MKLIYFPKMTCNRGDCDRRHTEVNQHYVYTFYFYQSSFVLRQVSIDFDKNIEDGQNFLNNTVFEINFNDAPYLQIPIYSFYARSITISNKIPYWGPQHSEKLTFPDPISIEEENIKVKFKILLFNTTPFSNDFKFQLIIGI